MTLLSDDAVAALVEAAQEGTLAEGQYLAAPKRRAPVVRTVDFRRTVKFKSEHQDRLKRGLEMFCRTASSRVSSELRAALEFDPGHVEQGMWSRAHADVKRASVCLVLTTDDSAVDAPCLVMAVEHPIVLEAVDRLLGSDGSAPVHARSLTEVDKMVARRLFATLTHCIAAAWKELCGQDLALQRIVTYEQSADVTAVEEPTLVMNVDVKMERGQSNIALLVPFNAIDALLARMTHQAVLDPRYGDALAQSLADVGLELRAQVGEISMSVEQVLGLAPGDVVALDAPAAQGVTLYADGVPIAPARPGRNAGRRAIQVDSTLRRDA